MTLKNISVGNLPKDITQQDICELFHLNSTSYLQDIYNIHFPKNNKNGKFKVFVFIRALTHITEAVVRRCSVEKVFIEISQNSQENTYARVSFLIKFQAKICNFIKKEALAQVFSCEFCEISKITFFHRTPLMTVSDILQVNL